MTQWHIKAYIQSEPCSIDKGHYSDVIIGTIASQITRVTIVYSIKA